MRLIFMGTPAFSVVALRALIEAGHDIACVFSQPPRPARRGQKEQPSPVQALAEAEGLPEIFREAGFDWREPGCSMCLAMNPDKLQPGERCASTSNRNFEGRQGRGGRTHLVSPAIAAATAIAGHFASPDDLA